ncbi:phosphonate transport system substrate-binding protein [Marinobacter daqiaonensis]|uniref:Phosphonate transport system substrate-binding protein n=1 Tax=Marinobacter daqiaonensis TaxID=650891 RepID=A0A1I6GSF5_9GAMM|nr:putative selenate ABC transporter substrate-binding protein [Marinobacter daqiaonensis]SFR45021.1 phosphonate transport system substrate-binding protein [Marinobacter daqiaonensis]
MLKKIIGLATVAAATACFAFSAAAETFVFTAIPDQDETKLVERFGAVEEYLEEQLGVEVRYIPVKSYAAAVSAFRNNQVQLAWFGGLSGVQARRLVPGSEAIAQGVEDPDFQTFFIANHESGLERMAELTDELRGKTFTFGSKGSTSGRLMPEFYIREAFGEAPDEVFSRVGFSGNHTRTIRLVEAGTYDIGAVNYKVWESQVKENAVDTNKVQVIWETPYYADYQWTIRGDVDERFGDGFKERVTQALLNMDDPELLERFPRKGFIPASNEDYDAIEDTAESLGLVN